MIDIKKKYKTRSGLDVNLISDKGHSKAPIIGFIEGATFPSTWDNTGVFIFAMSGINTHPSLDLIEVKEKKVMYVNVYDDGFISKFHASRELADRGSVMGRIACIRVEYQEGQFDD